MGKEKKNTKKKTIKDQEIIEPALASEDESGSSRNASPEKKQKIIRKKKNNKQKEEESSQNEELSPPEDHQAYSQASSESRSVSPLSERYSQASSDEGPNQIKRQQGIKQFLDDEASESQGNEQSEPDEQERKEHIEEFLKAQKQRQAQMGTTQQFYNKLVKMKEDEVNQFYESKLEKMKEEQREEEDKYMYAALYQIGCRNGMEQDLVGWILNKKKYSLQYPNNIQYYCTLLSAMAMPKRFPGLIFLQAKSIQQVQKSIRGLKFVRLKTLKKIEYEILTNLFDTTKKVHFDYKVKQYVRIKAGRYKQDIGQITKINKKGVLVQVVPRIDFSDIQKRLEKLEFQYRKINFQEDEIVKAKNSRFRQLVDPRGNERNRANKKKLTPQDFQPFTEYSHIKKIKITADGLLLVNYYFNEIEFPKTTFSPEEIIQLNRAGEEKAEIIKREEKNIRMGSNLFLSDPVQIIAGELTGCYGKIEQVQTRIVKIKCYNKELKGLVIEEISDNVVRLFKEGDSVIVTHGASIGEVGIVLKSGISTVKIKTATNDRIKVNKRDIQLQNLTSIVFDNDIGIKQGDMIKTRMDFGIVCSAKKRHVDFVTPNNQIKRATNNDLTKVTNYKLRAYSLKNEEFQRDCLVRILQGRYKNKIFKIKQVYNSFLFLHNPGDLSLFGNWVEKAENCLLHLTVPPRIEARFLEDQGMDRKFFRDRRPQMGQHRSPYAEEDPIKVGKYYYITRGAYRGVKGLITATFKTHFQVLVFNSKTQRINRTDVSSTRNNRRSPNRSDDQGLQGRFLSRGTED